MASRTDQDKNRILIVTVLCFLAVALLSQFNLILGLVCWTLLASKCGSSFADNSGGMLYLLLALVQTGLFALLWAPVNYAARRKPVGLRCGLVVALTAAYIGFWLGWTDWAFAEMARTGRWL